jgi:endonuclease/exonuclease/phosphatase family metal-dependent hydrolase
VCHTLASDEVISGESGLFSGKDWMKNIFIIVTVFEFVLIAHSIADTLTVGDDEPADYTSIQEAIDASSDGDVVFIYSGNYFEQYINPHGKRIQIKGEVSSDWSPLVTIDSQENGLVVVCNSGENGNTQFQNLILKNGFNSLTGGGMVCMYSSPSLTNCVFVNNRANIAGGGLALMLNSSPVLNDCDFKGNTASFGGAVYADSTSNPLIYNCNFCENSSPQIEGLYQDGGWNSIEELCITTCDSDVNNDGEVGVEDLLSVIDGWGVCGASPRRSTGECSGESILDRQQESDIRVATWNVLHDNPGFHPATGGSELLPYIRVLRAIDADVIVFNEITRDEDVLALPEWLNEHIRPGIWQVHDGMPTGDRTVIASHFPMQMLAEDTVPPGAWQTNGVDGRGVTLALIDCPDEYWQVDLYLLGVHMKCCSSGEDERQLTANAIANWLGDARTEGDEIDLQQDTPMIILGDMNFYSEGSQPEITIITGDITDEKTYGPDIKGDWDESNMADPLPLDPITGNSFTLWDWKNRTDRFIVTDSVIDIGNSFILNTTTLPENELIANCLEALDTTENRTSDHLPVVVDFREPFNCENDLTNDGVIDVIDLLIVIDGWGPCP